MKRRLILLTFGGPDANYYEAMNRLREQASSFKMFDEIYCVTDEDLKNDDKFWSVHSEFIKNNPRGYGYWIWKPYLIIKYLDLLQEGDIMLYADCGCELNVKGKSKMYDYIKLTERYKIIGTNTTSNDINYTKRDLVNKYFGCVNERNVMLLLKGHMQAGCLMMIKTSVVEDVFKEMYRECCNYYSIDDSPSKTENDKTFKEHRHDQSVLNMIVKKRGLHNYYLDPAYFHPDWNRYGAQYPIWYNRNKTGVSKIEQNI